MQCKQCKRRHVCLPASCPNLYCMHASAVLHAAQPRLRPLACPLRCAALQNTLYELSLVEGMGFQREALAEEEPAGAQMQEVGGGGHAAMRAQQGLAPPHNACMPAWTVQGGGLWCADQQRLYAPCCCDPWPAMRCAALCCAGRGAVEALCLLMVSSLVGGHGLCGAYGAWLGCACTERRLRSETPVVDGSPDHGWLAGFMAHP